jgi:uncharacterized metal-binding protein
MPHDRDHLPLVYSCSGCSSAAQLANHLAVRLDREGVAEMSCIAGVGGNVPSLVRKAMQALEAGRTVVAIDGCVLSCCLAALKQRGLEPTAHVQLAHAGVRKTYHADFDAEQAQGLYGQLVERLAGVGDGRGGCGCGGGCGGVTLRGLVGRLCSDSGPSRSSRQLMLSAALRSSAGQ